MGAAWAFIRPELRRAIEVHRRLRRMRSQSPRLHKAVPAPGPLVLSDPERAAKYGFASVEDWQAWVLEDKRAEMRDLLLDAAMDDLLAQSRPSWGQYWLGGHE